MSHKPNLLYVYTTNEFNEIHKKHIQGITYSDGTPLHWRIKVGWTTQKHAEDRIAQQKNASTSSAIKILEKFDLPEGKDDHDVHEILRKHGYHQSKDDILLDDEFCLGGSEWFDNIWLQEVEDAVKELKGNSSSKINLTLRDTQRDVVNQVMDAVRNNDTGRISFLLGAVCRFGKNVCMLQLAKELFEYDPIKYNTILYTSYKVFMFSSIKEDANTFKEFENINVINLDEIKDKEDLQNHIYKNKPNVIITSCQSLLDNLE